MSDSWQPRGGQPRRPVLFDHTHTASIPGGEDPGNYGEVAHMTANVIVTQAHADATPDIIDRLVRLVEREGIDTVAALWSTSPPNTLPGALWRLYLLREWVRDSPDLTTTHYRLGRDTAHVSHAIAGPIDPPTPTDIAALADTVLSGAFTGALDVALARASAFCQVVSVGASLGADSSDASGRLDTGATSRQLTHIARRFHELFTDFQEASSLARAGLLD